MFYQPPPHTSCRPALIGINTDNWFSGSLDASHPNIGRHRNLCQELKHVLSCHRSVCIMRRSNCSAPIPPPGHPRGHHFFCCCPGVLITLISTCHALYNHQNHPFFECPDLFYHTHIFSDPGAARGGWGQNNLTGAYR